MTKLKNLISKYEKEHDYYLSNEYNEAQLRSDFLDEFFKILGWDIVNEKEKRTSEREVLLEESLRSDVTESSKKPDYTFRLFSERKFFLEAKKPSVKIHSDPASAKQIRRYGFTAKLKISALSNFEYLAIYDCSKSVMESDLPTKCRIKLYHYTEYIENFSEIEKLLGKSSVYNGVFDEQWSSIEEQLKLFSIDKLFLGQINEWRVLLGRDIYSYKTDLNEGELNDIVQSYINSIIFLRVCEDRNLEEYKSLLEFANNEDFNSLKQKFREADTKYNAGLFNNDLNNLIIESSSSIFWDIIKQLYYPESTYSFSVFASDIIGEIYEIFLGDKLVVKNGHIELARKPEKEDRDIITTPYFVVQDILRETIVEYCNNKTDVEILQTKFADIACGSGTFLLETYQVINDLLIDYYKDNCPEKLIQIAPGTYKLSYFKKRLIIENCIFGVDKDYNAVEACKFGLLLKLLEDENLKTIPTPALPDLSQNIFYGNSLVSYEDIEKEQQDEVNPFNFSENKFDVIIGNPPYLSTESIKQTTPVELPIYKAKYKTAYKQFDKYFLFIERSINLLKEGGYLGYVVPNKFTKVGAAKKLRNLLSTNSYAKYLISFGAIQIFQDKTTYTCILIIKKECLSAMKYLEVRNLLAWKTRQIEEDEYENIRFSELEDDGWILVSNYLKSAFNKIEQQSTKLEELIGSENIYNGIQTSANAIYVQQATKEKDGLLFFDKDGKEWKIEKQITRPYFKTTNGSDSLNTYRPLRPNSFVIYPYIKTDSKIEFISRTKLKTEFPNAYEYLTNYKDKLSKRDIKPEPETDDEWYRYGRSQCLDKCDVSEKIIVGVLSQGNKYAIDYNRTLISSGGTAGYCMITLPEKFKYSLYYIQTILNSKYLEWYASLVGEVFRGGYIARGTKVLKKLPIRTIDFDNTNDKRLHDSISKTQAELIDIQRQLIQLYSKTSKKVRLQKQFKRKIREQNNLLKELYNLGEDEERIPLIKEIYAAN